MTAPTLHIFARWPEAGMAKTRLIPDLGAQGALAVYRKLLAHTLAQAVATGLPVTLRTTGADPARFRELLGDGFAPVDQGEGDLGDRLARVEAPAIVVGSDCPDCDADVLRTAAAALETHHAVIGPAADGGYYLIGFRQPMPGLFEGMAWSTATVFADTMARFAAIGVEPAVLGKLRDIDTAEDLAHHPRFAP